MSVFSTSISVGLVAVTSIKSIFQLYLNMEPFFGSILKSGVKILTTSLLITFGKEDGTDSFYIRQISI